MVFVVEATGTVKSMKLMLVLLLFPQQMKAIHCT